MAITVQETKPVVTGAEAQAMFESMFTHTPLVDVRTPQDVAAQRAAEGWRGSR